MTFLALGAVTHARPALVAEYVHQARIGIRRLRSCWKLFEDWVPQTHAPRLDAVRELFAALGAMRDGHVVIHSIEPMLVEAGMPASRSEEHTSELQSLMRISYAVFCLKKKIKTIPYSQSTNYV